MQRRTSGWRPPHCPNPNCRYFKPSGDGWPYKRKGFYTRALAPKRIQRFTCLHCGRHFSVQTFSVTYWQKQPRLMESMFLMIVGCMANRQIARALGCAPSTVTHQISRLGRHNLLFQARELERIKSVGEIVIDGFESFEYSQYHPFHHNLAVEVESGYLLFHTDTAWSFRRANSSALNTSERSSSTVSRASSTASTIPFTTTWPLRSRVATSSSTPTAP